MSVRHCDGKTKTLILICRSSLSERDLSPEHWVIESEDEIQLQGSSSEHGTPPALTGEEIIFDQQEPLRSVVVPVLNGSKELPPTPNTDVTITNEASSSQVQSKDNTHVELKVPESPHTISQEIVTEEPPLDDEILRALGDPMHEKPKYGLAINGDLAIRWTAIAKGGLDKEAKEKLFKEHLIPENCILFQAPKLNPEIIASISDSVKNRDKKIELEQQQLGHGITALSRGLSLLIKDPADKLSIIKLLSDASKILADLHQCQTVGRKKLITPLLDKKFIEVSKDIERDEFLYGKDLSEKIKSMKNIQRSGLSIKKDSRPVGGPNFRKPGVNYNGPPRSQAAKPYFRSGPRRPSMEHNNRSYKAPPQAMKKKPDPKPPARK